MNFRRTFRLARLLARGTAKRLELIDEFVGQLELCGQFVDGLVEAASVGLDHDFANEISEANEIKLTCCLILARVLLLIGVHGSIIISRTGLDSELDLKFLERLPQLYA